LLKIKEQIKNNPASAEDKISTFQLK